MDMDTHKNAHERADAPDEKVQPIQGDDAETIDKAIEDQADTDASSASASDADGGDLRDAGDTE